MIGSERAGTLKKGKTTKERNRGRQIQGQENEGECRTGHDQKIPEANEATTGPDMKGDDRQGKGRA